MKIGLILECGPDGADLHVCRRLITLLLLGTEISSVTMDNKPNLLKQCGDAAAHLLEEACDKVVIVWDLYPAWREKGKPPCLHTDREEIFRSLTRARVDRNRVDLVCIREELEAWLLADGRALSEFLSTASHPVKIPSRKNPERINNPKKCLTQIMQNHHGRRYQDYLHAKQIAEKIPDVSHLRHSETFRRFADKITG